MNRRHFLFSALTAGGMAVLPRRGFGAERAAPPLPVFTNNYPFGTFAKRAGQTYAPFTTAALDELAATGVSGVEFALTSPAVCDELRTELPARGLAMPSVYVGSVLYDEARANESIANILALAAAAQPGGTKIIVTNPAPLRWNGPENKTDAQLRTQARALERLGGELRARGLTLAYHHHDIELRQGARELHHMLASTDPEKVKFCLDAHWAYRGCGNSELALHDLLTLYGARVVELHLRQSHGGTWAESFTAEGDIDYLRLAARLRTLGLRPLLVLEQAVEKGSPHTLDVVAAHRRSVAEVRRVFGA